MTGEPLQVPLDELRRAFDVLIRHVEGTTAGGAVPLDKDYFWSIPSDEQYDVLKAPGELTIGQLTESWQHLQDLLADEDRALGYHLVWLADVLRAIGQDLTA
ncbi:hypothetical protein [Streptomyces sp. CBMA156]|uniref:hypothetical protein n=1 Tax=Streptomyces sp. CBMA156 TaxID=1930280 RepID=UPI001661D035|nr:hypothetical protein [Streptomyces sp. CBMA156]MBD0672192.1 hypothetical protein [Streptomyces sp. CBMA156]